MAIGEHTVVAVPDQGNPLWAEVQALTKERDALRAECAERTNRCCTLQEEVQELKNQLATANARANAFLAEVGVLHERISKAFSLPVPD